MAGSLRHNARRLARKCFRPAVWRSEQYAPRAIALPARYSRARPPANLPSFGIVTPVLNQASFVRAAIDSVSAQAYPELSYIVQDGGSTDGTVEILQSYGSALNWSSLPDAGQGDAINRGFSQVTGDIMAWLNGDDLLLPGTLAYVARYFDAHPEIDLVYGHRIYIDIEGQETGRGVLPAHDSRAIYFADFVPQETLFWRRRVWEALAPLEVSLHCAMDWEFILRAQQAGFKFKRLPRFLGCFRAHTAQKSNAQQATTLSEMALLRRHYFGRDVPLADIHGGIEYYLLRHVVLDRLYRLGAIRSRELREFGIVGGSSSGLRRWDRKND